MLRFFTILSMLALCGCNTASSDGGSLVPEAAAAQPPSPGSPPKPETVAALKSVAAKQLKNPNSARWERMQQATRPNVAGKPMDVVCGYVNAKNSFGGYIGAKPFIYFVETQNLYVTGADDNLAASDTVKMFCSGLV
jgi:hypothetical protein